MNPFVKDPGDVPPFDGCGDHSCIVRKPKGVGTNGGCRCDEHTVRRACMWWRRRAVWLQLKMMRELKR